MRSGSRYGSGSSITARTTLKIAEVAPMPSASVSERRGGKARRAPQHAEAVTEVAHRVLEERRPDLVARVLPARARRPPNLTNARRRASSGAHPGATILLGLLIEVKAHLLVETALERVALLPTDRSRFQPSVIQLMMRLRYSIVASRTRLTARDIRRHCASSSLELPPAGARQRVVARAAVVLGDLPLGSNQALALEPVERGIERALPELQHALGPLLDPLGDAPAVHRLELQRLEHEHVERALQDIASFPWPRGSLRSAPVTAGW